MRRVENCCNCVYSYWDFKRALWTMSIGISTRPVCANQPDYPGRMRECPLGGVCRNFRLRPPIPKGDTVKTIPLGDGFCAYVDASDYEWLSQWTWHWRGGYAVRYGNGKWLYMHNEILPPPRGKHVDHKNLNKLDNTRENLRHATREENMRNKGKQAGTSSRFRGVSYRKGSGKWQARIWLNGRNLSLGTFASEVEAARAYDRAAVEYYGEFARLNFPEEWPPQRREAIVKAKVGSTHASPVRGKRKRTTAGGRTRSRATGHRTPATRGRQATKSKGRVRAKARKKRR